MNNTIDILIELAFELGGLYQHIYENAGLDNVIDFNDIALANSKGAQWKLKGDMSDVPELFRLKDKDKIDALNKVIEDLKKVKLMAREIKVKDFE